MKNRQFEDATRQSAIEILNTIAETMSAMLRQNVPELKDNLFPAYAYMMTEVKNGDDLDAWYEEEDTELQARNDPASVASDSLQRMSVLLGEKTTLACSTHLVKAAIESPDWKESVMGHSFLGAISEACKKQFKSNLDDIVKMTASGFVHQHPIVRYTAMQSCGFLLHEQSPSFQKKYHQEMIPMVIKMMREETHLKLQTQATAVLTSFISGLLEQQDDDENLEKNKEILVPYSTDIVQTISGLFQVAIDKKY